MLKARLFLNNAPKVRRCLCLVFVRYRLG